MDRCFVRKFTKTDLEGIRPVAKRRSQGTFLPGDAYTFGIDRDGRPFICMCCGLRRLWSNVGEAWAVVSSTNPPGPQQLKEARNLLRQRSYKLDLRVLVAFVPEGFQKGGRFAEFFGFQEQARIPGLYYPYAGIIYVKEWVWEQK